MNANHAAWMPRGDGLCCLGQDGAAAAGPCGAATLGRILGRAADAASDALPATRISWDDVVEPKSARIELIDVKVATQEATQFAAEACVRDAAYSAVGRALSEPVAGLRP